MCRNNANFLDETDGFTACVVQAHIFMQTTLIYVLTWALRSISIYCSTVLAWNVEDFLVNKYKYVSIIGILIFPTIISSGGIKTWGSETTFDACFPVIMTNISTISNIIMYILMSIGVVSMILVLVNTIRFAYISTFTSEIPLSQVVPVDSL